MQFVFLLAATHASFLAMILYLTLIRKVKRSIVGFLLAEYFAAFTPFTVIALLFEQTAQAILIIFILHNLVLAVVAFFIPSMANSRPTPNKS